MIGMSKVLARRKVIPALLSSTLNRFYRSFVPARALDRASQRNKILFESLEPRMLMSADFIPAAPLGSQVHMSNQTGSVDSADSAGSSYTLALDAGQRISVVFNTDDTDLQGRIQLYGTDGTTLLGDASASAAGLRSSVMVSPTFPGF